MVLSLEEIIEDEFQEFCVKDISTEDCNLISDSPETLRV